MGELTRRTLYAHTFFKNTKSKSKAARVDRSPKLPNAVPEGHTLEGHPSALQQTYSGSSDYRYEETPDVLNIPILNNKSKINSMGITLQNNGRDKSP